MKKVYPDYYAKFHCIAGQCRHNCCIGWEIDIDRSTMRKYQQMQGSLGDRIRRYIAGNELDGSIVMQQDGRCPFLNQDNLCDLILEKGEKVLCDICKLHPRFINDFADRREYGLGLTCEAACALILRQQEPMRLLVEDDGRRKTPASKIKMEQLRQRDALISLAQDRTMPIAARMARILQYAGQSLPDWTPQQWAQVYLPLEYMSEDWHNRLLALREGHVGECRDEITLENLLVYFIYRHMLVDYNGLESLAPAFAVLSTRMVCWLCRDAEDILEAARLYSSEIEYSDQNVLQLLNLIEEEMY